MSMFTATTVRKTMEDAGYYKSGSRETLSETFIEEQDVQVGGKGYKLSKIAYWDAKVFTDELDGVLSQQNPRIHDIYGRYALNCFTLVRLVNGNTHQGFKGARGSGNELDMAQLMARRFYDPDNSGAARTSWVRTIAAAGSKNYFEGSTTGAELAMSEEEGMIWLAFYNPATTPCIDGIQIIFNTESLNYQDLDFDQVDLEDGDPIIELKEPWTLPPEQSGEMLSYYYQVGTDETRPIGLWVQRARDMRNLTTLFTP